MDAHGYSKKATILVVDDTPENLILMSNLLKDEYKVKIANGGAAALKIAAEGVPPDLILLDIVMSGMDGYEVCRRLKRDSKTVNIPVIFVTSMAAADDEQKGLELGAIDYITKPISPPIVLARVRNHLALKAMIDFLRDQNDWDIAERLAFTLKGISGKVSVTGLQQFADKLDVAIREHRARKQGSAASEATATQPDDLIAQLELKLLEGAEKTAVEVDPAQLKLVCDKLKLLLADDDAAAADLMSANANLFKAAFPNHYRKIDDSIRAFDFEAALAELRQATALPV